MQKQQQEHKETTYAAPDIAPAPPVQSIILPFGIVFGADVTREAAMDEVKKAKAFSTAPITLYKREGSIRSVAGFMTRADANQALPDFAAKVRRDSYVVDLRSWCPAALAPGAPASGTPPLTDCKY